MNDLSQQNDQDANRIIKALAEINPESGAELAALADMSETKAIAFAMEHSDAIKAERIRARLSGRAHIATAHRLLGKAFERIDAQLDSADGFEAVELIKPVQRALEAAEKARLAERDKTEHLPVFHITINAGGVQVRAITEADIVDVPAKELGGQQ